MVFVTLGFTRWTVSVWILDEQKSKKIVTMKSKYKCFTFIQIMFIFTIIISLGLTADKKKNPSAPFVSKLFLKWLNNCHNLNKLLRDIAHCNNAI